MKQTKKKLFGKILPIFLIVAIIFNLLPLPEGIVYAAESGEEENEEPGNDSGDESGEENNDELLEITDFVVTPTQREYDGSCYEAATISGEQAGDKITYQLADEEETNTMPMIDKIGQYSLTVKVERTGYKPYETTVVAEIFAKTMNLTVTAYEGVYDKEEKDALSIEGILEGDVVEYRLNGGEVQSTIPKISDAGTYTISVHIERENYLDYDKEFTAKIEEADLEGVEIETYEGIYDEKEHTLVSLKGTLETDEVEYKVGTEEWSKDKPVGTNANEYEIKVRVKRENYALKEFTGLKAIIGQQNQSLVFNHFTGQQSGKTIQGNFEDVTFDFSATDETKLAGGTISYSLEFESEEDKDIAQIDENGILTVKDAGTITVVAKLSGNQNYSECEIRHTLTVFLQKKADGDFMSFDEAGISYILGENSGVVSTKQATKIYTRDNGTITYSIDKNDIGLVCEESTGKITVEDYNTLVDAMNKNNGVVTVEVTAVKSRSNRYDEDTVSYGIQISFMETPENPYVTSGTIGENDWYISDVTLKPADNSYTISDSCELDSFGESVSINDKESGYVYLRHKDSGGITNGISYADVKVDTIQPTMEVSCNTPGSQTEDMQYYSENFVGTITITEKNFVPQNILVTVTKENGTTYNASVNWSNVKDVHTGKFTIPASKDHTNDGDFTFTVAGKDEAGNELEEGYVSETIRIDTKVPTLTVSYSNKNVVNTLIDSEGNSRQYLNAAQVATITVEDEHLDILDTEISIAAKDVAGGNLDQSQLISQTEWKQEGNQYVKKISFTGEANYKLDITCKDLAKNTVILTKDNCFTVDKSSPKNLDIQYSTSIFDTVLEAVSFGFYNAKTQVTIIAEDDISGINTMTYSYVKAGNVSNINGELINQTIPESSIAYSNNGKIATAKFEIPSGALGATTQFNGNVEFTATDRTGLSSGVKGTKRLVVDNISPTISVSYNDPVSEIEGILYYDENVTATITIEEANFYAEDVKVMVTKDEGTPYDVTPQWEGNHTDIHVGTILLAEDGNYTISIDYTDKSTNKMETYTSDLLVVDTVIEDPIISINGKTESGLAYQDEVIPEISFEDDNFEDYEVLLTRTRYGEKDIDVTEQFISGHMSVNETGGHGTFDEFDKTIENDGIYTLSVTITDKAGHESNVVNVFTVNRFGSVYEYEDYLAKLVADGGAYVNSVTEDLIITEYNADRLVTDSINIEITKDGKPLEDVAYEMNPEAESATEIGESGWFQYEYRIDKENFMSDGVYKISISSEDETGNTPENNNYEDKLIVFRVDNTIPEITSVVGLEETIVNAQEVEVKYDVYDTIGLKSVNIYVDGKPLGEEITDFGTDSNNYSGSFVLEESKSQQKVQIVVEDMAGNITDTDSETFTSAYAFHNSITVSTNVLVRFTANKPLLFGTIIGTAVIVAAGSLLIVTRRKKRM